MTQNRQDRSTGAAKDAACITRSAYDRNAQAYADTFRDYAVYRRELTRFRACLLEPGARVLDIGCGPGLAGQWLRQADSSIRLAGVDLSKSMVCLARQNLPDALFVVGDIRKLPIRGLFDAVIASFCIVHLTDMEVATLAAEIGSLIRPGGALYLSFMTGRAPGFETTSFSTDPIYYNYFETAEVTGWLAGAGLLVEETTEADYLEPDGSITCDVFFWARKRREG